MDGDRLVSSYVLVAADLQQAFVGKPVVADKTVDLPQH